MVFFVKRRLLSKNPPNEKSKNGCLGLTTRQWALLDSMLIFTFNAVITMCSILGYIHSNEVITILHDDIKDEMSDSESGYYYYHHEHANHAVLYLSVDKVLITNRIMAICTWASLLNLFCAALLMYGVSMKAPKCIIPWLAVSVTCFVISFTLQIVGHYNVIPNVYITWKILVLTAFCGSLLAVIWYCIFKYYRILSLELSVPSVTVYQTKQGYRHTISAFPHQIRKV